MALIPCTECGRQVSDRASACPQCGAPVEVPPASRSEHPFPTPQPSAGRPANGLATEPVGVSSPARTLPLAKPTAHLRGVGGWLAFLIVALMVIGPLRNLVEAVNSFADAESQHPNLASVEKWKDFKSAAWMVIFACCALSFVAGWRLWKSVDFDAVVFAKWAIWISGPAGAFVLGAFLPWMMFGSANPDESFWGAFLGGIVFAVIWTTYLSKSKRVEQTYTVGRTQRDETGAR